MTKRVACIIEKRKEYKCLAGKPKVTILKDLDVGREILLKWISEK